MQASDLTNESQVARELDEHTMYRNSIQPSEHRVPDGFERTMAGRVRRIKPLKETVRKPSRDNSVQVGEGTYLEPFNDEVVLRVDRFKDEAQCRECSGSGCLFSSLCLDCAGEGKWWIDARGNREKRVSADRTNLTAVPCDACKASSYDMPLPRSTGFSPCKACKGTGQRIANIAVATAFTEEPSTGRVLAVGPECKRIRVGDRILFDTFAGKEFKYGDRRYRIMRETYPLGRLIGDADFKVAHTNYGEGQ